MVARDLGGTRNMLPFRTREGLGVKTAEEIRRQPLRTQELRHLAEPDEPRWWCVPSGSKAGGRFGRHTPPGLNGEVEQIRFVLAPPLAPAPAATGGGEVAP